MFKNERSKEEKENANTNIFRANRKKQIKR